MAHKCSTATCEKLIHTDLHTCNACLGVTSKAFERAPTKIRGATIDGEWVSGRKRSHQAGMADVMSLLQDTP